jgi:hypothetical protein
MSEMHVYVCNWQRKKSGYEGWIEQWPKRRVREKTFYEMRDALYDVVGEEVGDGEPQFEFEPPFVDATGWEHLFRDGWRSTFFLSDVKLTTEAGVFDGGFCGRCKRPIGNRTNQQLTVEWGSWAAGITSFAASGHDTMRIPVASEALLDIFTPQERKSFDLRPVQTTPSSRTSFYEFISRRFVSEVAGKLFQPEGWQCHQCGRRFLSNAKVLGYGTDVVSRDAIESGTGLFFLGDAGHFTLCFSADRWQTVKRTLRAADITSSSIAIIEPGEAEESLVLREYPS